MSYQVPVLNPTDYPVWTVKFKSIMDAHVIWKTVKPRVFCVRISRNRINQKRHGCQDKNRMDKQHGVNIKVVEVLDVAVGPGKIEMVMNVYNDVSCYLL